MAVVLLVSFLVLLGVGMPVALTMGGAGLLALLQGGSLSLMVLPQQLFRGVNSFPLMAVPFFILAAELMTAGGLTKALLRFSNDLVGHIRGGLGHANVLVSMLFAGISGSALADAAGPSAVVMRMMRKTGYAPEYSAALSAATATIGPIIPPSILMVVYAITDSRVTVAGLFLAGIIPGVLLGLSLIAVNHWVSTKRGYLFRERRPTAGELIRSFWKALPGILMPAIILGGILAGIFTATEAGAAAVAYALIIGVFVTRDLTLHNIPTIFIRAGVVTSAVLLIVSMATVFSWLLTLLQIPQSLALLISDLTDQRIVVLILISVFVLMCGLVIDTLPALIILVPVLGPIATQFGIDPLHFAMILVLNLTIGMITPPVGPVLFVVSTVGRLRLEALAKAVMPLLLIELVVLVAVIFVPALSTTLPNIFGYTH